ncbi:hypothetical protein LSAT2_022944 [Lamellibrachia satsuma]|nr:hypothetical protein LSAT2_022944 [Lamellibrachia satsuma]
MLSLISVKPENHTLQLNGVASPCDVDVPVNTGESSTLNCSVDSKPQANFTWSSEPDLGSPLADYRWNTDSYICSSQSDNHNGGHNDNLNINHINHINYNSSSALHQHELYLHAKVAVMQAVLDSCAIGVCP